MDVKLKNAYQRIRFGQQYPEEAVQFIQSQLQDVARPLTVLPQLAKDKRVEVRALVALLYGEYGDAEASKILWLLTRDEFESVRLTAAGAIARLGHLTIVTGNVEGLQDERPAVRRLTASILAALGDKSAEEALIDALKDDNELVRTDIVKALSKAACGTDKALSSLIEALHDPSVNVRDRAAQVLGGFQQIDVVDPLVNALKDPDWHVRAAAADALGGWVKIPVVVDALIRVLENDTFALVRDRAADALSHLGDDERVVPALVKALGAEQRDVRFHAAQALISAKASSALPLLTAEWRRTTPAPGGRDAFPDLREKIMDIFGRLGGGDQLPVIIEGTNDSEPQVQLAAVNALRRLKERGAGKQLNACLTDKNPHVRAAAVRAIGDLGEKEASIRILPLLRDESSYVRSAAAEALGKLGDRTAIIPLIQVLTGEKLPDDPKAGLVIGSGDKFLADLELTKVQTRTRAIEALGVLRAPEAVEPIIKNGLTAEDAGVRAVSAYALGQIGDVRAVEPLKDVVRSYYLTAPTDLDYVINPGGGEKVADEARRMKEKESRVRASVTWALGQIGDAAAKETLLKAMNDQNSLVRDSAFEALAKIAEKEEAQQIATDAKKKSEKTP
ncbi:MAG: HEAT repeat domain-containing protein [Verrucomicrobiota bacterium]